MTCRGGRSRAARDSGPRCYRKETPLGSEGPGGLVLSVGDPRWGPGREVAGVLSIGDPAGVPVARWLAFYR